MLKFDFEFCLIPESMISVNVRSKESEQTWKTIRTNVWIQSGYKCLICGRPDTIQCHEHWNWDDVNRIQYLSSLASLCSTCHETVHLDTIPKVLQGLRMSRMAAILDVRESRLKNIYKEQLKLKFMRSQRRYDLEYSLIDRYLTTGSHIKLVDNG